MAPGRMGLRCSTGNAPAYKRARVVPAIVEISAAKEEEEEEDEMVVEVVATTQETITAESPHDHDTHSEYEEEEDEEEEEQDEDEDDYWPSTNSAAGGGYFSAAELCSPAPAPIQLEPLPGLIYSSYGEESGDAVLGSSGSPPTAAARGTPLPVDRNPASPEFDAWNELFQTYYEMSSATPEERVHRGGKTYQIYEHFVHTAKQIAKTIISEMFLTPQKKSISSSNAGGVGGGEKYCARGIFFKFVRDAYGLYGGDHFSMKAAGHEIKSMNALLQCNIPQLHLPMVTVVDYWGWRVFAEAALPINKLTIVYGSDNGGRHVHDSNSEMQSIMRQAASMLNLKEHIVARNLTTRPKSLFGPCDIEGHRGTDGRFYIVDTARLYPAEGAFGTLYAVKIPVDSSQPVTVVHLSASGRKDLLKDVYASLAPASRPYPPFPPAPPDATAAATTPGAVPTANLLSVGEARPPRRLSRSGGGGGGGGGGAAHPRDEELVMLERICVERKCDDSLITLYSLLPVDQWAPRPHDPLASNAADADADAATTVTDEGNETSAASAATVNKRAACLTGQEVHGDVLVLHATKLQSFYYLLRPELVKSWKKPLSSDAFSNFGVDNAEEHEAEVEELTRHLRQVVIPDFVTWASANSERVVSGLHMPPLLHKFGINLRYLGYLYCLFTQERLKYNCIGFQMIARTLKNILRAKLRAKRGMAEESYRQVIVEFFNLVFGEDERSDEFWEHAMPIHLRLKYGPFAFAFSPTENTNLKFILGKLALFQMLQEYTGVRFNIDGHQARLRFAPGGSFVPLTVSELEGMEATVKGVDIRSKILPSIAECCPVDSVLAPEAALYTLTPTLLTTTASSPSASGSAELSSSSEGFTSSSSLGSSGLAASAAMAMATTTAGGGRSGGLTPETLQRAVELQERHRSLVRSIYSPTSPEMAASTIRLADLYSISGAPDKATQMMRECIDCLQRVSEIAGEVLLGCLYLMAVIAERDGNGYLAYALYEAILASMLEVYDSTDDPKSASPFEVELRASLARLLQRQGENQKAEEHRQALQKLLLIFPNALSRHPYQKVLNFLAFKNLSGYNFNPQEMDLQSLAEFLDTDDVEGDAQEASLAS